MEGVVLPFSQMYAVFILWPVPAENCIFFKNLEVSRQHFFYCPFSLHIVQTINIPTFDLRGLFSMDYSCAKRRLKGAAKQGQQKNIL